MLYLSTAPTSSEISFTPYLSMYSAMPSTICSVVFGFTKFAVPTETAVAQASIISMASEAFVIPPIPIIGILTACAVS